MSHAIVMGGSTAGKCVAAALARNFDRVTVLERDREPGPREPLQHNRKIELRFGVAIDQPLHAAGRVKGVRLRDGSELHAELVVDATGRSSQSPTWLYRWGYGVVTEQRVRIVEALAQLELVGKLRELTFPEQLRRCYGLMRRLPEGYLIVGDAMCSFDPTDAQAMTLVARQAEQIAKRAQPDRSSVRLQRRLYRMTELPFGLSSAEGRSSAALRAWLVKVFEAANHDPVVFRALVRVMQLLASPASLLRPRILWRVLTRRQPQVAIARPPSPFVGELTSQVASPSGF